MAETQNHAITQEFQFEKFFFKHERAADFIESHWQEKDSESTCWLIYRWFLAGYFASTMVINITFTFSNGKWLIYYTNWGYMFCVFKTFLSAILVSINSCCPAVIKSGGSILKIYWASHYISLVLAMFISTVYWIAIFPYGDVKAFDPINFQTHATNSIFMVFDQMLVAFPTYILHFVYPLMMALIFGIFAAIYQFSGGTNLNNEPFIYKILDWNNPKFAMIVMACLSVLVYTLSLVAYGLYRLRCAIHER